jgi:hypothetical protein
MSCGSDVVVLGILGQGRRLLEEVESVVVVVRKSLLLAATCRKLNHLIVVPNVTDPPMEAIKKVRGEKSLKSLNGSMYASSKSAEPLITRQKA